MEVTASKIAAPQSATTSHDDYQPMLEAIRDHFSTAKGPLFTTDISGEQLWSAWLAALPPDERQHHACNACRRFVEHYGGLVTIAATGDALGHASPAMFGDAPGSYARSFAAVNELVARARVTGVHVASDPVWGLPQNSDRARGLTWRHMHVIPPAELVYGRGRVLTAGQRAAELGEDYKMLGRALGEFRIGVASVKSDYHSIRHTIEAFSRNAKLEGDVAGAACGLAVRAGSGAAGGVRVRVHSRGTITDYTIDRWD